MTAPADAGDAWEVPGVSDDGTAPPTDPQSDPRRDEARALAVRSVQLFYRRVPVATWWDDLSPLLSDRAKLELRGVDTNSIRPLKATGPATVRGQAALFTDMTVPTDGGDVRIVVVRSPERTQWAVDRIEPPDEGPQ